MFQANFGVCLVFLFLISLNSEVYRMTFMTTNGIFLLQCLLLIAAQNKDVFYFLRIKISGKSFAQHFHVAMTSFSSDNSKIQTV